MKPYLRYFLVDGNDILAQAERMSEAQLDTLPFGATLVGADGMILRYNRTEAEITGRDQRSVLGRNFFLELAVCGIGPLFQGRYKQALLASQYDEIFPYVFHYQMPETVMLVRVATGPMLKTGRSVWIFVRRMMPSP
jgi:photoactive yellow protein